MIQEGFSLHASADFERLEDQALIPRWCDWQFGIPHGVFRDHVFWHRPGFRNIWVAHKDCRPGDLREPHSIGLIATRRPPPRAKPTSIFLQRFAAEAAKNVYTLTEAESQDYLRRRTVRVEPVDDARGFCVVRTVDYVLGCGRIDGDQLHSEAPKSWFLEMPD